jgi:hypothetical protein
VRLQPEHAWWHYPCNWEVISELRPTECRCGIAEPHFEDMGWRVGYNSPTYSYYSTEAAAWKDKRL